MTVRTTVPPPNPPKILCCTIYAYGNKINAEQQRIWMYASKWSSKRLSRRGGSGLLRISQISTRGEKLSWSPCMKARAQYWRPEIPRMLRWGWYGEKLCTQESLAKHITRIRVLVSRCCRQYPFVYIYRSPNAWPPFVTTWSCCVSR